MTVWPGGPHVFLDLRIQHGLLVSQPFSHPLLDGLRQDSVLVLVSAFAAGAAPSTGADRASLRCGGRAGALRVRATARRKTNHLFLLRFEALPLLRVLSLELPNLLREALSLFAQRVELLLVLLLVPLMLRLVVPQL